jgi:signal peptidase I
MLLSTEDKPPRVTIGQRFATFLRELAFIVIGAIIVSSLLRAFVGQMFIIPSGSMENTLLIGDRVVVEKITQFERGEVVVFADPGDWLSGEGLKERGRIGQAFEFIGVLPDTSTEHLIKRVIGMPGDTVVCCDTKGRITVNGKALNEKSYLYQDDDGTSVRPSEIKFTVVVPKDRIFVMGDHRDASADSRCHLSDVSSSQGKGQVAFVPVSSVVGPAFAIAAPFDRSEMLGIPPTFSSVPAPKAPAPAEAVIKPAGVSC